jgi:hypothetical protein
MTSAALALALTLAHPSLPVTGPLAASPDTVEVRGSHAVAGAVIGAVIGAVALVQMGNPEGAGDYEGLARVSLIATGAALGAAAGAFIGSRWHTRRAVSRISR